MNKRLVIVLGCGVLVSMVMALLVQSVIGPGKNAADIETKMVNVMTANRDLKAGDILDDNTVRWAEWPQEAVFSGLVVWDAEEMAEAKDFGRLLRPLRSGEPVVESALIQERDGNLLAASLQAGMRAMAIRVSAESSVGGFVTPGDRVDVILTYQVRVPRANGADDVAATMVSRNASQTVLENTRVLAVDQKSEPGDGAKVGRTVTLEVDSKGSETLALASSMGELSLVLRKIGDETTKDQTAELTTDMTVSSVLQKILEQTQHRTSDQSQIRVYQGAMINMQPVRALIRPQEGVQNETLYR